MNLKERKTYKIDQFQGVDFTNSPLNVQSNRATDMKNFITDNGVNRKRYGWEEVLDFYELDNDGNRLYLKINGVYQHNINNEDVLIVHAGTGLYRVFCNVETGEYTKSKIETDIDILDQKSMSFAGFFANKNAIFIVGCGKYMVYYDNKLEVVENNEHTYIPTTSIMRKSNANGGTFSKYEDVNMLSSFRKNTLIGSLHGSNDEPVTYNLDSGLIDEGSSVVINAKIKQENMTNKKIFENKLEVINTNYFDVFKSTETTLYKENYKFEAVGTESVDYIQQLNGKYFKFEVVSDTPLVQFYKISMSDDLKEWTTVQFDIDDININKFCYNEIFYFQGKYVLFGGGFYKNIPLIRQLAKEPRLYISSNLIDWEFVNMSHFQLNPDTLFSVKQSYNSDSNLDKLFVYISGIRGSVEISEMLVFHNIAENVSVGSDYVVLDVRSCFSNAFGKHYAFLAQKNSGNSCYLVGFNGELFETTDTPSVTDMKGGKSIETNDNLIHPNFYYIENNKKYLHVYNTGEFVLFGNLNFHEDADVLVYKINNFFYAVSDSSSDIFYREENESEWDLYKSLDCSYLNGRKLFLNADDELMICVEKKERISYLYERKYFEYESPVDEIIVGLINYTNGTVQFFIPTTPPNYVEGDNAFELDANIEVKFSATTFLSDTNKSTADYIDKCAFGLQWNIDGTNVLILSGNKSFNNLDFTNGQYGVIGSDYSYFSEQNITTVGNNDTAIIGYNILNDGVVAIHKQNNKKDPVIYYKSYITNEKTNVLNLKFVEYFFSIKSGSIGNGAISKYGFVSFYDDNLYLSESGLYGIVLNQSTLSSSDRFARERSRYISEKLKKYDLSSATVISHNTMLYIFVDGVAFVADARYKSVDKNSEPNTFNYEWWFWENIPCRVPFIHNNDLWFGTASGKLCKFTEKFYDTTKLSITSGLAALGLSYENSTISYPLSFKNELKTATSLMLKDNKFFHLLINEATINNNKIYVDNEDIFYSIHEDYVVYIDNFEGDGLEVNVPYIVKNIDTTDMCFELWLNNEQVLFTGTNVRVSRLITDEELYITNLTDSEFSLNLFSTGDEPVVFVNYNGQTLVLSRTILNYKQPIVAEWVTVPMDLGNPLYAKTMVGISTTVESVNGGNVFLSYLTRRLQDLALQGVTAFDIDNTNFLSFSFENAFYKTYSKKLEVRNINYIMFKFSSNNDKDCKLHNLMVTYKYTYKLRGVN